MYFLKHTETSPILEAENQLKMLQSRQPTEPWFAYFMGNEQSVRALISAKLDAHKDLFPISLYCTEEQAVLSVPKTAPGKGYILAYGCDKHTIKELTQTGQFHKSILYAFSAHEFKHNQMYPNQKKAITVLENQDRYNHPATTDSDNIERLGK